MLDDRLGREACAELSIAERREWLLTSSIGGYASGAAAGYPARGYHGLLVAALDPPLDLSLKLIAGHRDYHGRSVAGGETPWCRRLRAPAFEFSELSLSKFGICRTHRGI